MPEWKAGIWINGNAVISVGYKENENEGSKTIPDWKRYWLIFFLSGLSHFFIYFQIAVLLKPTSLPTSVLFELQSWRRSIRKFTSLTWARRSWFVAARIHRSFVSLIRRSAQPQFLENVEIVLLSCPAWIWSMNPENPNRYSNVTTDSNHG